MNLAPRDQDGWVESAHGNRDRSPCWGTLASPPAASEPNTPDDRGVTGWRSDVAGLNVKCVDVAPQQVPPEARDWLPPTRRATLRILDLQTLTRHAGSAR